MQIPSTQRAIQLVGPNQLMLNPAKPVLEPGPEQVLAKVEAVGLCFSDLKLLRQFSAHARKSEVISGLDRSALDGMPNYVPNDAPTVPGHETVVRILKAGRRVTGVSPGDRFLVQPDYRWLKTDQSNAAFGYNFEGALQEYVLMDQRVITSPAGDSMLLPVDNDLPASAVAMVEPWACVEDSYVVRERQTLKAGGRLLVLGDAKRAQPRLDAILAGPPAPADVIRSTGGLDDIPDESVDDVLLFGADADLLEAAFRKVAKNGLVIVVACGEQFGRDVTCPIGRFHYGGVRVIGTGGCDPGDALGAIPPSGEIREGDRIDVVGAGGPMGTMHVIRNMCQGVKGIAVFGGDRSHERLAQLDRLCRPLAAATGVAFEAYHADENPPAGAFDYVALMVPAPDLVAMAIDRTARRGIINIFAGIPASVYHPLDLDTYIQRQLYFVGTSGSDIEDMRIVLGKVAARTLDTNLSVAAVSGLDGAVDGIRTVEQQLLPGKIIVYPACEGLGLTPLSKLRNTLPEVAEHLADGAWTAEAERELLERFS